MAFDESTCDQKERLNNDEFRELIPKLNLDEYFLIEVNIQENWMYMFEVASNKGQLNSIMCNICSENITFNSFRSHINMISHKNSLKKVMQFFHPIYTYAKASKKIAKGECGSTSELQEAIIEANVATAKADQSKLIEARRVAKYIQRLGGGDPSMRFEKILASIVLKSNAKKPEQIFVKVCLPLAELLKLEFSIKNDEWKKILSTDKPHPNSKYYCALCSKFCPGIITVNYHLNGYSHKCLQLETVGVRSPTYLHLTKNCSFQFDKTYSMTVKSEAKEQFKEEALKVINSNFKSNKAFNVNANIVVEKSKEMHNKDKIERTNDATICNTTNKTNISPAFKSENIKFTSEISAKIAAKAKALSAYTSKIITPDVDFYSNVDNEGLIGVEYVIKVISSTDDPAPMYECSLCETVLNEPRMQGHLISYNHRLKYCIMHYPDTIEKYKNAIGHRKYKDFYRVLSHVIAKLALAIEKHHGRSIPCTVSASMFKSRRPEIVAEVYNLRHACQQHGPSFSNIVSSEEILEWINGEGTYQPQNVPPNQPGRFTTTPTEKVYLDQRFYEIKIQEKEGGSVRQSSLNRSKSPNNRGEKSQNKRSRSRSYSPQRDNLLNQRPDKSLEVERCSSKNIWKLYRKNISLAASEVEYSYMEYRKNPESHPRYEQEWNSYWKRRKEELLAEGIDHRSYNYQLEWVPYFKQRLDELFSEALYTSKYEVRKSLNIPPDAEEDSQSKFSQSKTLRNSQVHERKKYRYDTENLDLECSMSRRPLSPRAGSPEFIIQPCKQSEKLPVADNKANIIHVLRLMTALEDYLGSLGSKIMDLLSTALVLEKKYIGNPMQLEHKMLTESNCNILETAMEKLKGILYAGFLDDNKVQGFNRVIEYTTDLLKHADKMGWRNSLCDSEKSDGTNELQKLIEVMKTKRNDVNCSSQKSLSDTLMELISSQRQDSTVSSDKNNLARAFSNNKPTSINTQGKLFPYGDSSVRPVAVDSMKPSSSYSHTIGFHMNEVASMNQVGLANFNTNLNRSEASIRFPSKTFAKAANNANNDNGSGRNSYNTYSNNCSNFKAMNTSSGNTGFGTGKSNNNVSSFGQQANYFNMNQPSQSYRNSIGNIPGNNWGRFQNSSQPWFGQQQKSQQYQQEGRHIL